MGSTLPQLNLCSSHQHPDNSYTQNATDNHLNARLMADLILLWHTPHTQRERIAAPIVSQCVTKLHCLRKKCNDHRLISSHAHQTRATYTCTLAIHQSYGRGKLHPQKNELACVLGQWQENLQSCGLSSSS